MLYEESGVSLTMYTYSRLNPYSNGICSMSDYTYEVYEQIIRS